MLRKILTGTAVAALLILTGCVAPAQKPVAFASNNLPANARIGVLIDVTPAASTAFPGAGCLLCAATASAMNASLTKQVTSFSVQDLGNLDQDLVNSLQSSGYDAFLIDKNADLATLKKMKQSKGSNTAAYDFSSFGQQHNIDYLLVVQYDYIGVKRNYSSYVPTSAPYAVVKGSTYLVDLRNHTYNWYSPIDHNRTAEGEWDEPPTFPGVTNAYYLAVEEARDQVIQSFVAKSELISANAQ